MKKTWVEFAKKSYEYLTIVGGISTKVNFLSLSHSCKEVPIIEQVASHKSSLLLLIILQNKQTLPLYKR
jgi:hypothetical protein